MVGENYMTSADDVETLKDIICKVIEGSTEEGSTAIMMTKFERKMRMVSGNDMYNV